MSKKIKICFNVLIFVAFLIFTTNVYGASATLSTSNITAEVGDTITVSVNVSGAATWQLTATSSGSITSKSQTFVRADDGIDDVSKTVGTLTLKADNVGTGTITLSGNAYTSSGEKVSIGGPITITVKEKYVPPVTPAPQPNTNNNKPTTNNNTTTNKPTTNTTGKSSNANLKNMIVSVEGLTPAFSKNITAYSLNVGENVNEIKINASVEHSRAVYSVSGNTNLKEGENVVKVRVTAEDGTVKTYTINVLKSDNPEKSDATLSSLIIEDVDLGQAFDSNITEYNAGDITVKANKLNIYAYTNSENAKIEIIGNENLEVGEGKVTIRVTSENGKVTKDYVVSFNKLYSEEETKLVDVYGDSSSYTNSKDEKSLWDSIKAFYNNTLKENMTVIFLYIFVWVEFVQIVYLYERLKKHEDVDKITVRKRIKPEKVKKEKIEKPRRVKENPIFPEEEDKK